MSGLSDEEQIWLLKTTLVLDGTSMVDRMVEAWKEGNEATMGFFVGVGSAWPSVGQSFQEKLFDDRNVEMTDAIEGFLRNDETCFVVVGAGHLLGELGIVSLLGG